MVKKPTLCKIHGGNHIQLTVEKVIEPTMGGGVHLIHRIKGGKRIERKGRSLSIGSTLVVVVLMDDTIKVE